MAIELEDVSEELSEVTDTDLEQVADLALRLSSLQRNLEELEEQLKSKKEEIRKLSEDIIPAKMAELNMTGFSLSDGSSVSLKNFYSAHISKTNQHKAFEWLKENGFGDLIKNQVSVSFGRGEEEKALAHQETCLKNGLSVSTRTWVEAQTLKAFVRERIEEHGEALPPEFGVYTGTKTVIEKPRG